MKLASLRKTNIICFLLYLEFRKEKNKDEVKVRGRLLDKIWEERKVSGALGEMDRTKL